MASWQEHALQGKLQAVDAYGLLNFDLLHREIVVILGAIRRCDSQLHAEPNADVKGWVIRARELADDVDDWADLLIHRVQQVSGGGCTALGSRILSRLGPVHRDSASELRKLTKRAVELIEHSERLGLNLHEAIDPRLTTRFVDVASPRLTTCFVDVASLVGLDGPMGEVTKMVTGAGGETQLKVVVVSIVGMAGSGKTTLAAAVYQQLRQHNCFQLHAFVSVGQKPDAAHKAVKDMLSELGHELGDKSCLIVVDDLWSREDWEHISSFFIISDSITRIITTIRNLEVARKCGWGWSNNCIYNIGLLNEVDSKKLILDRSFGIGHGCPKHLEDVIAQITRRCSGLPVALVTVPSMVEDKFSKYEWDMLVGSRWLSRPDAKVMKQIFNRSYSDLPQDLKPCLLDLSIFPEDFKVDVDRLVRRGTAEGSMKDLARSDIYKLISRNMVQPLPRVHGAPRYYCRLHPVIHDFLVCKSMEENFVTLVDAQNPPISSNCSPVYRRLSVQSSKHDQDLTPYDGMDLSHVRSITVFGQASGAPRLTNLRVVRVLDLEGCVGPVCLDGLDKLPLLSYLSLKGTDVARLPASLWELTFMEFLDVRSTKVKQLPSSIVGLRHSLRTLLFGRKGMINSVDSATRMAEDIDHYHGLEYVATIDLREDPAFFLMALGSLNRLRDLQMTWSFHQCTVAACRKELLSSMEKLSYLRSLTIHCGLGCCMEFLGSLSHPPQLLEKFKVTVGGFVSVPKWIQRLDSLYVLQITICKIDTDDLKILRNIPILQSLILGLDFVPREPIVIESEGFRGLQRFSVNCPVPWLTFQAGAMPKLTHLQLEFCSGSTNQESVPSGIGNLQRLTEVVLLYNQKWCADSSSVRMAVDAVKREVAKHGNRIDLFINGTKADVQKVEEMKSTTEIQSADAGEEIARITLENQGETEIEEAECDNISKA